MAEYPRKIVIAVDGSSCSIVAFEWYCDQFKRPDDNVVLLHVSPSSTQLPVNGMVDIPQNAFDDLTTQNSARIEDLRVSFLEKADEQQIKHIEFIHINDTAPGSAICKFVKKNNADHIVIGTRGLGKVKRTLLGSVSDYVIHNSNTIVTIVPST